jgi:peptidoglycan hydrolase-like protein with peptidoglycan-binding domain
VSHPASHPAKYLCGTLLVVAVAACAPATGSPVVTASPPSQVTTSTPIEAGLPDDTVTQAPAPAIPTTTALMAAGATGNQVRELQARLKQLEWYDGDVTATYDDKTASGVRGFQTKRGFPATGEVDQTTWDTLLTMTRQPTDDELHNRLTPGPALLQQGSTGAKVRDLQARLKQIGWWSGDVNDTYGTATVAAVKAFQTKRGIPVTGEVDQRTLDRLGAMTRKPTTDELNNVKPKPAAVSAEGLDPRCLTGRAMCVSKRTNKLVWVVDGVPQARVDVRFGSQELPTRDGAFRVFAKSRDHVSTLYHTAMPYAMFFSGGQAVHYSPDFAARGYRGASHGCVNVRDLKTIAWLFDQVRTGDSVVVYR